MMSCTHALFNLPAGFVGIVFYHVISSPAQLGEYIAPLFNIYMCSMVIASVGSLADAIIYFFLFPAFRHAARQVLCCSRTTDSPHLRIQSHLSSRSGAPESSSQRQHQQQVDNPIQFTMMTQSCDESHLSAALELPPIKSRKYELLQSPKVLLQIAPESNNI